MQDKIPDFRIARDGAWYHDGEIITRAALAKLFSDRALKIDENGDYWLQTPYEKYAIDVEDVPFVIVDYEGLTFISNMEEALTLDNDTHWELRDGIPYVELRDGLFARLSRSVLYNLIAEHGAAIEVDGISFALGNSNGDGL